MDLPVVITNGINPTKVKFFTGNREDAQMTRNWPKILEEVGIKEEGEMCVFTFVDSKDGFVSTVVCLN